MEEETIVERIIRMLEVEVMDSDCDEFDSEGKYKANQILIQCQKALAEIEIEN